MNYFEAREHERFLRKYREAVNCFWRASASDPTEQDILEALPEVRLRVRALGTRETTWTKASVDITDLWGDYIDDVVSPRLERRRGVISFLDRMIGLAALNRRRAKRRLLSPWHWPVDLAAFALAFPVRVLRAAGMPPSAESQAWVRLVQAVFATWIAGIGSALALRGF